MLVFTIRMFTKFNHIIVGIQNKLVHKIMSQDWNCLYETGVVLGYSWNHCAHVICMYNIYSSIIEFHSVFVGTQHVGT